MRAAIAAIRRWGLVFVVVVLAVAAGVGTYAFALDDQYASSGIVAFRPKDDKPVSAQVVLLTAPRYVAYATSPYVVQEVATLLELEADELADAIVVTMPSTTANLEVKVTWSDRQVATRAASALIDAVLRQVESDPILSGQLVSPASVPSAPAGPPRLGITAVGFAAGVLVACVAVWLLDRRDRRTRGWEPPVSRTPERASAPVG